MDLGKFNFDGRFSLIGNPLPKIKREMDHVRENGWAPAKEVVKITSSSMKIAQGAGKLAETAAKVIGVVLSFLGLTSFISAMFNAFEVPAHIIKAVEQARLTDIEGAFRSGVDALSTAAEVVGDTGGGVSALTALGAIPFVAAFSIIALPFAIAGLSYACIKGVYDMAHHVNFLRTVSKTNDLKALINERLCTEGKLDPAKVSIMERRSDKKMVELMKKVIEQDSVMDLEKTREHMKGFMWRKIGINTISLVGNMAMLATLIAAVATVIASPIVIPAVAGAKALLGLARFGLKKGFDDWHETNARKLILQKA